jgi:hypothetical protein
MIRDRALEPQSAKPSVGQIEVRLFAQPPFGSDAEAVADQQHPHYQLRIDRGPPGMAVERRKLPMQTAQIEDSVDLSQQMIGRHPFLEPKFIEQPLLPPRLLTYSSPGPPTD